MTDRDDARDILRKMIRPNTTVYTQLLSVSRSGMSRQIAVVVGGRDGSVTDISGLVARATGTRWNDRTGGVVMSGAGMDMGFALVYSLGRALWPDGHRCTSKRDRHGRNICRSNDHANNPSLPYDGRKIHKDSGYALRQSWL